MREQLEHEIERQWLTRTKPPGSLGRLETLVRDYLCLRGRVMEEDFAPAVYLFAADHGITAEGVSPYPSEVTAQMLANFQAGGAAINVLARRHNIPLYLIDAGVGAGTANFAVEPAMTEEECGAALEAGREWARRAAAGHTMAGLGEMGIGNTTTAAALLAAYTGLPGAAVAGPGTGLPAAGVAHKAAVIDRALALHEPAGRPAQEVLRRLGGLEIAQMAGFVLEAARLRLPVMLDGFITTVAALAAVRMEAAAREVLFFAHRSAEPGHTRALEELGGVPLLDLGMRLGEGTGAVLGLHLVGCGLELYAGMASFASAGVSEAKS
jgi:nicotinate-nucleotide--dimethylbenzimidazole phosphoribosyltransferase